MSFLAKANQPMPGFGHGDGAMRKLTDVLRSIEKSFGEEDNGRDVS
jgi:hypothetical protein